MFPTSQLSVYSLLSLCCSVLAQNLTADQLKDQPAAIPDADLEGFDRDPTLLKVVDRRWYEKNKHIYPMSVWEDFDPAKDYSEGGKKDREGNAFFFSSR